MLRYFVKEELPRIRYANPSLNIVVNKSGDPKAEGKPTMTLEFGTCILVENKYRSDTTLVANSPPKTFSLNNKWSTAILTDLMSTAGSPLWDQWVEQRKKQSLPTVEDAKPRAPNVIKQSAKPISMRKETGQSKGKKAQGKKDSVKELLGLSGEATKPATESSASSAA